MKQVKKTTRGKLSLQYIAGYIDADGCIAIAKVKNRYNKGFPSYYLRLTVMGIDKNITEDLKDFFGGSIHCKMSKHGSSCYKPHHRIQWRWEASGNIAMQALKKLTPYLRAKKKQAEIGIKFQTEKDFSWRKRYRGKSVPIEEVNKRELLYKKMRQLKLAGETLEAYRSRRD